MSDLLEKAIACPYCGESIDVLVDTSVVPQEYIEDCQVCCRPITIRVTMGFEDTSLLVEALHENDY